MAASTNTNQINLTSDVNDECSVVGTVVLLKDENLTLSDGTAVDYSNYGNYKALKVTDNGGTPQYVVSLKGHLDVIDLAVYNSSINFVKYPLYQHSMEYSQSNTPLADIVDQPNIEDRENGMFLYDSTFDGTQTRTQRFNDVYQKETSGTWVDQGAYDLIKGAKVGDSVSTTFFKNQGIRNKRTEVVTNDGRLAELQGNSDIYIYYIRKCQMPNDERVDSNKIYTNEPQWSVRPGINMLLVDTVASNNKTAFSIYIDAQGFRTGGYELGYNENNFFDDLGAIGIEIRNHSDLLLTSEYLMIQPNTVGYDKAGRFLGTYSTQFEADNADFPVYVETHLIFPSTTTEYYREGPHYWSLWDADYGSIGATNPDIMTGELVDDPFCFDRHYSSDCNVFLDDNFSPWYSYRFLCNSAATGGGGSATSNTSKMYSDSIINKKIQFQNTVQSQFNLITKGNGLRNIYKYKTKKYRTSTQDRPTMLRTISMTYMSFNSITIKIITENGATTKEIVFDGTTKINELPIKKTTTKVVGLKCKTFELELSTYGSIDDILEINKLSIGYG